MMIKLLSKGLVALFLICGFNAYSQNFKKIDYRINEIPKANVAFMGTPQIQASDAKFYQIDIDELKNQLVGIMHREHENSGFIAQISLPHPDGSMHEYNAKENSTMHPDLSAGYSEIKTYDAHGLTNGGFVKWDITQHGFHAMITIPGESTIFIDPVIKGNSDYYIVYSKKNFITDKLKDCSFNSDNEEIKNKNAATSGTVKSFGTCELRTYRLALSATGEYTTFHGGTVALALAAQVTTMNRVNGVYEKDMAITMVIIPNNNLIVYTNSGTDPFTNGTPGTMINQNQSNTDAVIGNGNYDIGHVFGTNSGGLAGLGVVCTNTQKARGVTGSGAPIGDPFDIDYVAHEMGHQFGGNHTFNNSCGGNRNNATAIEPGSGSTIMAYAGICPPDVQSNSDDHFSGKSLEEIGNEILSAGHTCEVITALANSAPILLSTNGNVTVPANTPFALTANATDADGDPLTYNWEQMDNGISTQAPVATSTIGPNFRSISSLTSPTRYFPNLVALNAGGPFTWEVIPSVTRTMNFRVTVRDNSSGSGGCNDHGDITLTTDAGSGPFIVNYPSATGIIWAGASSETVTWSVANTANAPVACGFVDILLSTDGGLTFPTILASGVPNDGSQLITVPNVATTTAIVMVMCANGTFFDISNNNFEITMATFDYTLNSAPTSLSICQPNDAVFNISIGSLGGYNDPVTLSVSGVPAGATSNFSINPVTPIGTSNLTISNTGSAAPGVYSITITANSTTGIKTNIVTLTIASGNPSAVSQISPANGATGVSVPTTFTWTTAPELGVTYEIDIATDAGFASIVDQATGLGSATYLSSILNPSTTYFWRVRAVTGCGQSAWSSTFSFTTNTCTTYPSADVGQTINNATPTVTSTINITDAGNITDVNMPVLNISHVYVGDLSATLTSPLGTIVNLFNGPGIPASQYGCAGDNIVASFDDAAALTAANLENMCNGTPPAISGDFQSMDPMANFIGESITGVWTLTIYDSYPTADDGVLNAWSLELCVDPPVACTDPDVPTVSGTTTICNGNSTTLTIATGNLNDATNWQWYEGSCGGTVAGSGISINVSPTSNTSYFVRGEGGCVIPGVCQQVDVIVNPIYNETNAATICNGDTYIFGAQNLTTAGSYTEVFTSADGCDSTVVLTLTVNPTYSENASATICNGDTYVFGAQNLTTAGSYVELFTSVNGCDSTVTLALTVNPTYNENASATICNGDTYVFGTQNLTAPGSYTEVFTSASGCDSTVILALTVNPTYSENASATICNGDTYIFGTQNLTTPGTYMELFTAINGCDSTVTLALTVNPTYTENASATICNGDTYIFGAQNLTTAGSYTEVFTSTDGCDSTVILTLTVNPTYSENASATICNGDTYIFGAQNLTTAGSYTEVFTSSGGCDSTVILTLTVNPTYSENASATICNGDTYVFGTQNLTTPGSYTEVFTSAVGCDSTVILALTVNPTYSGSASAEICDGDSYVFGSQNLTTAGTYVEPFTAMNGCDSTVTLTLTVNPVYSINESASICQGDTYTYPDATTGTVSEIHTSLLTTADGCDSTIITTLTVNDPASMVTLTSPLNGATGVGVPVSFTWTAAPESGVTYEIQISEDAGFTLIVDQATGLAANSYNSAVLNPNTTYYWHVNAVTPCGASGFTTTFSFTTDGCILFTATDVPIAISASGTPTITSTINVPVGGTINDVNIVNLIGTHTRISDLVISLTSPLGTNVVLMDQICANQDNFDVDFDDEAASAVLPCPPTDGNAYQPFGLLSDFDGENSIGNWVLTISDLQNLQGGSLQGWSLQMCTDPIVPCTDPDLPTLAGGVEICEGVSSTLSVTAGNLNDATDWFWYEGSCGGTLIGSGTSVVVSPTTSASYFVRGEGGCVTPGSCTQFDIIVNPIYSENATASICTGGSYTFGTQTLTTAGTYTEIFSSVNGCDSTVVLDLFVITAFNETAAATICNGDSYTFGTQTLTTAGSYTELFTSTGGCDSTVVLTLTVNPTYNESASATICNGDSYIFGTQTLTTAGSYTEVFNSAGGCDSTVVLTLSVNPTYNESASATICNGDSYTFGTQTLTTGGSYTEVFTSTGGCDSTVVLTLTVNPTYNESATATICNGDSYIFGTQTLTTAGTYIEIFSSVNGCDSTVLLDLIVITAFNETAAATICNGDSYTFGTQTLTTAGSYTELFTSTGGCDSTVVLTLTVNPTYNESASATICNGDSYIFGTQTLTTAGTYTEIFTSANGCDSTVLLDLLVITQYNESASATICDGDTYTFGTQTLTTAGSYTELFTSTGGCDSTVVLTLTVNSSYVIGESVIICQGETYTFPDGTTAQTTQIHTSLLTTAAGCDSIIITGLNVMPTFMSVEDIEICQGDSYTFPDGVIGTVTQAHTSILTSVNGCDSIIVTALTVHPSYNLNESATICAGETYTFPDGTTGTTTQTYTSLLSTVNGCDSIIVTTLNVQVIDISVTASGKTLTANQSGASYQWIDCDNSNIPIAGETGQSFTATQVTGNYAVIVTIGSCSDTSDCYLIDQTGINEFSAETISIYPNPATNNVTIDWEGTITMIEVTDVNGKILRRISQFTESSYQLELTEYSNGVYFIHVESEYGRTVVDIVKL